MLSHSVAFFERIGHFRSVFYALILRRRFEANPEKSTHVLNLNIQAALIIKDDQVVL